MTGNWFAMTKKKKIIASMRSRKGYKKYIIRILQRCLFFFFVCLHKIPQLLID